VKDGSGHGPSKGPGDFEELAPFVRHLMAGLRLRAVAVFGSRARGDDLRESDYDLAVVSDDFKGLTSYERQVRLTEAWHQAGPTAPADFFALTSHELLRMDRLAVWDMLEDGRPLYDDGIWKQARREFRRLKAAGRITAVPGGWRVAEGPEDAQKI
jgi:hypothetical protein